MAGRTSGKLAVPFALEPLEPRLLLDGMPVSFPAASDATSTFQVTWTIPSDGAILMKEPLAFLALFNGPALPGSVEASDLGVDGTTPATGVTIVPNANLVVFNLPPLGDGLHVITIDEGSILSAEGVPIIGYTGEFTVDLEPPRIVSCSVQDNEIRDVGDFECTVVFSEPLDDAKLDESDFLLRAGGGALLLPKAWEYDPGSSTLTLQYLHLAADHYWLYLFSGDGALEDLAGHDLDGEPIAWPIPPNISGDGIDGGDFVVHFMVDEPDKPAAPFARLDPAGSLMFVSRNKGRTISEQDVDRFGFAGEGGETIAAILSPADAEAVMTIGLGHTSGLFTASGPGQPVVLPLTRIDADGHYDVLVSSDTPCLYTLDIYRNALLEAQIGDSSHGNQLGLDDSFVDLGSGRYGLIGDSQLSVLAPSSGGRLFAVRATGTTGDATIYELDPADGAVLNSFPAPVPTLYPGPQGLAAGPGSLFYVDGSSPWWHILWELDPDTGAVIDFDVVDAASPSAIAGLGYLDGRVHIECYGTNEIIVWDPQADVRVATLHVAADLIGGLTGASDLDVLFGCAFGDRILKIDPATGTVLDSFSPGVGSLTGGLAYVNGELTAAGTGDPSTAYRINPLDGAVLGSFTPGGGGSGSLSGLGGDGLAMVAMPEIDEYTIDLVAGHAVDMVLAGQDGADFSDSLLELLDDDGTVLAVATADPMGVPATVYDLGILGFVVPQTGTYTLRLTSRTRGQYGIVVSDSLVFETEPNDDPAADPLRSLDCAEGALGYLNSLEHELSDLQVRVLGTPWYMRLEEGRYVAKLSQEQYDEAKAMGFIRERRRFFPPPYVPGSDPSTYWFIFEDQHLAYTDWDFEDVQILVEELSASKVELTAFGGFTIYTNMLVMRPEHEVLIPWITGGPHKLLIDLGDPYDGCYAVELEPGDEICLRTATPGDSEFGFGNALDPGIELYDPNGALVASDSSGLDGKNATISYIAIKPGTYTVRVVAESGMGEYVVHAEVTPDTTPPVVEQVDIGSDFQSLIVQLNDDDLASTTAENIANYRLWAANGDANGNGDPFDDGDEVQLAITSASYDAALDRITLYTNAVLFDDFYRLELDGDDAMSDGTPGITDLAGNFLDGGDYTAELDLKAYSAVDDLLTVVDDLDLSGGAESCLTGQLEAALTLLGKDVGSDRSVLSLLNAFIRTVNRLHDKSEIDEEARDELIAGAEWIKQGIGLSDN